MPMGLRVMDHLATGLVVGRGFQALKSILGSGELSMILLTLASSSGVHFSNTSSAFRLSSNWAAFLAPMRAESRCSYLMAQARARCPSLQPSYFWAMSESSFRLRRFFSVALSSQKSFLTNSRGKRLFLSLKRLTSSSVRPSRYLPVRKPPASGLQPTRPQRQFLKRERYSVSFSGRLTMLYSFCAPMGLCRLSLSQRARALKTLSASQLEVAQQKAFPASTTSWKARQISSKEVRSSQQCAQMMSTQSSCSLWREPSTLSLTCLRLRRRLELMSGLGASLTLVAITTSSLGTARLLSIFPSCVSALPASQISAVSKWLMPFWRAVRMSCSSASQVSSRVLTMLPSEITEVSSPEFPKQRQAILPCLNTDIQSLWICHHCPPVIAGPIRKYKSGFGSEGEVGGW